MFYVIVLVVCSGIPKFVSSYEYKWFKTICLFASCQLCFNFGENQHHRTELFNISLSDLSEKVGEMFVITNKVDL